MVGLLRCRAATVARERGLAPPGVPHVMRGAAAPARTAYGPIIRGCSWISLALDPGPGVPALHALTPRIVGFAAAYLARLEMRNLHGQGRRARLHTGVQHSAAPSCGDWSPRGPLPLLQGPVGICLHCDINKWRRRNG